MKATIIHHGNCPDGFTAAWLIHRYLTYKRKVREIEVIGASYGTPPPKIEYGSSVYILDFCYEPEHLDKISAQVGSGDFVILDHHKTALGWLKDWGRDTLQTQWHPVLAEQKDLVVCDMNHSGAMLAMLYAEANIPFVKYIEDRDLWRWLYGDSTRNVFAAITSFSYSIKNWDHISDYTIQELIDEGKGINRYREQMIEQVVDKAFRTTVLGHRDIWVAPCPYAIGSDVAGILAERDPERFAAYYIDQDNGIRKWGLRSTEKYGMDVAELAATRPPGGGHKNAAGFEDVRRDLL